MQLYATDADLLDSVASFLHEGLALRGTLLVIASDAHRAGLRAALVARGADVVDAHARGRFVALDAEDTLRRFMTVAGPDRVRFVSAVGGLLAGLTAPGRPLRVYGEMVDILWGEGRLHDAIALEGLWTDLQAGQPFSLYCAYRAASVGSGARGYDRVCRCHTKVIDTARESTRRFEATLDAPAHARRFISETLMSWGLDRLRDNATLVASELVTNAVLHAAPPLVVSLVRGAESVRIEVRDANARLPALRRATNRSSHGRGLPLIAAVSKHWAAEALPTGGKVVWAEVS